MIQIDNLHYSYKKKSVFEDLSITFEPGNTYGLLGKNGTGKSTLFRNICGLLKPAKGKISVYGHSSLQRSPAMLSKIFLLPEEFFVPAVSVNGFIKTLAPFYPKFSHEDFQRYATDFDVPLTTRLDKMSMGQKKKMLIAFSLATNTELLLMDEPTNGLDIISKSQFKNVIKSMIGADKCVIISTHQVKDIEGIINQISVIDEGKILFNESIAKVGAKMRFSNLPSASNSSEVIFSEKNIHGVSEVAINKTGIESEVDMELLYKAIMTKPLEINKIFSDGAGN